MARCRVELDNVAQEFAELARCFRDARAGALDIHSLLSKIRRLELALQQTAIGVWIGAHAPLAFGRERLQFGNKGAVGIEQLLRRVAAQPLLELF